MLHLNLDLDRWIYRNGNIIHGKGPGIYAIMLDEVYKGTNKLSMDKTNDF